MAHASEIGEPSSAHVVVAASSTEVVAHSTETVEPPSTATPPSTEPPAPYPSSFSHIVELITKGEPVPGVREIPDTVLEGEASESRAETRRKPWEKLDDAACSDVLPARAAP